MLLSKKHVALLDRRVHASIHEMLHYKNAKGHASDASGSRQTRPSNFASEMRTQNIHLPRTASLACMLYALLWRVA